MNQPSHLSLTDIEQKVCDIASKQLGTKRTKVSPQSRIKEDLKCDSLDLIELLIEFEEEFGVTLPQKPPHPVYKAVFTRAEWRLSTFAELIYIQQGTGAPKRKWSGSLVEPLPPMLPMLPTVPFTQLGDRWHEAAGEPTALFEHLDETAQMRRLSDGMRCVLVPAANVAIGCDSPHAPDDEKPAHRVSVDAFWIDAEPVSTTAYCRFLNSIGEVEPEVLADWFVLDADDDRIAHMLIARHADEWRPITGSDRWPMILVSWFGANAYSLWANRHDWRGYRHDSPCFLPTEAQWEYAARGVDYRKFPWGEEPPMPNDMRFARHRRGDNYTAEMLPLADANAALGISPFGLHHMGGNVWQWCRDWYDEAFYATAGAAQPNPVNITPGKARSERGGVGSARRNCAEAHSAVPGRRWREVAASGSGASGLHSEFRRDQRVAFRRPPKMRDNTIITTKISRHVLAIQASAPPSTANPSTPQTTARIANVSAY